MQVNKPKCDFGCGQDAIFTLKNGKGCCSKSYQSCPELKRKNSLSVKQTYKDGRGTVFNDEHRAKSAKSRKAKQIDTLLCDRSTATNDTIKKLLFEELNVEQKCACCGISEWLGNPITLELDHINGINNDNRLENLRVLCPNCHSMTPTYKGRNINSGKRKVSDNELLTAFEKCGNIRQTLIEVGLAPKGGNYTRVKKLLNI